MSREVSPSPTSDRVPAELSSPMVAQEFALATLAAWRLNPISDDVVLIVTELVADSVRDSDGPVTLSLRRAGPVVRVSVRDDSPALPTADGPSPTELGGRGLARVAAIATGWGVELHPDGGKSVWAEVAAYA